MPSPLDRIQRPCELVKRALSSVAEARDELRDAFWVGGRAQHLDHVVRREHLSPHWAELAARSLDRAGLSDLAHLGAVLLIGGTTCVPQVRVGVSRAFPARARRERPADGGGARTTLLAADPTLLAEQSVRRRPPKRASA